MIDKFFRLKDNKTNVKTEVICGFTTFLTMFYILFTNSDILSQTGMPWNGVFVATVLSAGITSIFIALYTNLPFAMAPGMGINSIFTYTICMTMGYHWREALAISFLAGAVHIIIIVTPARKAFVNAFPEYLRVAACAGLGMFIAYAGLKNTGLLVFNYTGQEPFIEGTVIGGSSIIPSFVKKFSPTQLVAIIGFFVMLVLTAIEKRTGDRHAALPVGILIATFIGIPLNVTNINNIAFSDVSMFEGFGEIFCSFFGNPGLLSIFNNLSTTLSTFLMICILVSAGLLDSIGAMIGIGQIHNAKLFDKTDAEKFSQKGAKSKMDKALIANSVGGVVSPLLGSSQSTVYLESVTGIASGGRTGLTGLITGILFLICLPLTGFLHIVPGEAIAPALIFAGISMFTRLRYINWKNIEQGLPAFMTMLFMPLTYSVFDGIAIGILCHVLIQITVGKFKKIHPVLYIISVFYLFIKLSNYLLL